MIAFTASSDRPTLSFPPDTAERLLRGDIILETEAHTAWGAAVTAQMHLPVARSHVWYQVIDYPRWVHYFPDINQSRVLSTADVPATEPAARTEKRVYQAASKTFLFLTAQVEAYLKVVETTQKMVEFRLEAGSFNDFAAKLTLQDFLNGTLLTYFVQATPSIPVPSLFIQQAIHFDLPTNMRTMRHAICQSALTSQH